MRAAARDEAMTIDLVELRAVVNRLLDHIIETRGVRAVEIRDETYWTVPWPEVRAADSTPGELDVGSLADDWELLSALLDEGAEPVAYQLTELAPLIRYIGETLGRDLAGRGG